MITFIVIVLVVVFVGKTLLAIKNLHTSKIYLDGNSNIHIDTQVDLKNLLILIPVIREQNVIINTLEHFKNMAVDGLDVTIAVVGTVKEAYEKQLYQNALELSFQSFKASKTPQDENLSLKGLFTTKTAAYIQSKKMMIDYQEFEALFINDPSTSDMVKEWLDKQEKNENKGISYMYLESKFTEGDRATQLNYAFDHLTQTMDFDIVGVYDADSLPEYRTFKEVTNVMSRTGCDACQQPLHFGTSIQAFESEKIPAIISASAIFQTTWSLIKELPTLINYSHKNPKDNNRCLYLNGHGMFFKKEIIEAFNGFPSDVITDGVQIGYRLSMSDKAIQPVSSFCVDEMTDNASQMIIQHSRWFAGCMRVKDAYDWSKEKNAQPRFSQIVDGYYMMGAWAYSPLIVFLTGLAIWYLSGTGFTSRNIMIMVFMITFVVYNYGLPYLVIRHVLKVKTQIRFLTWLCLPLACVLKSIGPQIYFYNHLKRFLLGREIRYKKVER